MITLFIFAFFAGLVTVVSPCILPVLPILLSAGIGKAHYRPYGIVVGLVVSFTFFTLSLTALVHATGISPDMLRYVALVIIVFSGLTMLFPSLGTYFAAKTARFEHIGNNLQQRAQSVDSGFLDGLITGAALGLIWTPCAGPILATISTLVATRAVTWATVMLTFTYSLGTALPMFLIMYGGNRVIYSTQVIARYSESIRKFFGALMIMAACGIFFNLDRLLLHYAAHYIPALVFDNNDTVNKQLGGLMPSKNILQQQRAPEIIGIEAWINSESLTLEKLRGKVVLVDFWTYSCINCIRTLPFVSEWYKKYKDRGLVIIGVHTPEFEFEKKLSNVEAAVKSFDITYPVALDNRYSTWQNYDNHYWPAHYLIDQDGIIQETHFGEGGYIETENGIRRLLNLSALEQENKKSALNHAITPETYLGYARASSYAPEIIIKRDQPTIYKYTHALESNAVGLKGSWQIHSEYIETTGDDAVLDLNFIADSVYLVMQSPDQKTINVLLDGKEINHITVDRARMYTVCESKDNYSGHILTLQIPKGVSLYAFTFG